MKAYVDSACDIKYASFYIEGLRRVLGKRNVVFNSSRFASFPHNNFYLLLELETPEKTWRIAIDYADWPIIRPQPYQWCDLYCKINTAFEDAGKPKIFSIGPGFGIRIFSLAESGILAIANLVRSGKRIGNKARFLYDYVGQYKRPSELQYHPIGASQNNYIFFASSLWKNDMGTNDFRANFILACKKLGSIAFEGGFAPRARNDIPGFDQMTMEKRVGTMEYVEKSKKSFAVFNTPAVAQCHGWKLGEFLAMGKAIISTPLSRALPEPLVDGRHLMVTDGSQLEIGESLSRLHADAHLRQNLERAARDYYERLLAPDAVINSILGQLKVTENLGRR